jgi:hypothetical protein
MSVFKVRVDLLTGLLALASTVAASGAKRDDGRTGFLDPKRQISGNTEDERSL